MWGNHWMYGGFMMFFWILLIVGLVFFIKWIVDQGRSDKGKSKESAKRYAKGEISKEEFEEKKKEIVD